MAVDEGHLPASDASWIYLVFHALVDGLTFRVVLDSTLELQDIRRRMFGLVDGLLTPAGREPDGTQEE